MNNLFLFLSFPILFMLHELEEIAFMPDWLMKNNQNKKIQKIIKVIGMPSSKSFTLMVLEEYLIIILIGIICYVQSYNDFYLSLIIACNIHVIGHAIQAIYIKKYDPGLTTGILSFALLSYITMINSADINFKNLLLFTQYV